MVETEDELRALLEEKAGVRLDTPKWGFLRRRGYIELALDAAREGDHLTFNGDLDDMVAVVRDLEDLLAEYGTVAGDTTDYADQRGRVERLLTKLDADTGPTRTSAPLGSLVRAILVEQLAPVVAAFRERWLGGKALSHEEARAWLEEQSRAPLEPATHIEGDSTVLFWDDEVFFAETRAIHKRRRRALCELVAIAKDLQARFGCTQQEATAFILCGEIPPVCASLEIETREPPGAPFVVMRVPLWLQPDEVASIYKRAWCGNKPVKRFRAPSRRMAQAVTELVMARLQGERLTRVAERLGVRANLLSEWYRRARRTVGKILGETRKEEGIFREGDET